MSQTNAPTEMKQSTAKSAPLSRFYWFKRVSGLAGAGILFQGTGCAVDPSLIALDFFTLFGTSIISDYVFGAFNLLP